MLNEVGTGDETRGTVGKDKVEEELACAPRVGGVHEHEYVAHLDCS